MVKIIINTCFGGFCVSEAVYKELGLKWDGYGFLRGTDFRTDDYKYRSNLKLIKAIEKTGVKKASGQCSELKIVNIPNHIDWYIVDYDGVETIHENHKTWR